MRKDTSREIFERYYHTGTKWITVRLKNGKQHEGRFIGYFLGDADRNEPYIFRWHFLSREEALLDHDGTLNPDQGIFIEHNDILSVEFN